MANPVVHFEIGCRDRARSSDFYGKLFGWKMAEFGPATMIDTAAGAGIPGHFTALGHEPFHYTMFYVQVDNLQTYLDKAATLGGKTLVPPMEIPGDGGAFAWMTDPDGNTVGLFKPPAK
jgi:uncharacterized protein